ncbi:hypothetical protein Efla_006105 [Eimeria flavescens]
MLMLLKLGKLKMWFACIVHSPSYSIFGISEEDTDAAVRAAHKAFASWSLDTGARTRGRLLMKLADMLEEKTEEMAQLESLNVGKPISDARHASHNNSLLADLPLFLSGTYTGKSVFKKGRFRAHKHLNSNEALFSVIFCSSCKRRSSFSSSPDFFSRNKESDMKVSVSHIRYYAGWADKISGGAYIPVLNSTKISCHTRREPVGVVVAIVPWNFPLVLTVLKAAPALACGCTVVVKSSEKTPLSVLAFCKLVQQAGFPPGVFNVVNGWGDTVGANLIKHPLVNKVTFTGSSAVGRLVAQQCASTMKRVTLELGGKSPLVVLKDADIKKACEATWAGLFVNSGQCCVACSRVLVQAEVYEQFNEELKKCVQEKAKLLHPTDSNCTQGPIVDKKQLDSVLRYIEEGKKEGAKCILGGGKKEGKGYWVLPTIFTDVTDEMKVAKEEIFGPVVCISKFSEIEEAVKRANDTPYGLGAGVFTSSIPLADYFVSRLHAGTVWVNTYLQGDTGIPFGGYKGSGYGSNSNCVCMAGND